MANPIRLGTYNCTGFKSSEGFINETLCKSYNLIALQENWLLPHEVGRCDNLNKDFCGVTTSAVDISEGVLRGRPYGGLAWMWAQELNAMVRPLSFGEDRLLGLIYSDENRTLLLINVYMPVNSHENLDEFVRLLGKISSLIEEEDVDAVCVIGDFNAAIGSRFFN